MGKSIGVNDLLGAKFKTWDFEGEWLESFGEPEYNFSMHIYGYKKQGKTELAMRLAKYLTRFGKVYYNSFEQGKSKSLQDAAKRNNIGEVSGKLVFGNRDSYQDMFNKLKNGNHRFCIIDSRDYIDLTFEQWKELTEAFPRKSFILLGWEKSGKPDGDHARKISHTVDIIVHVKNFVATPFSRFGGNEPLVIWEKKSKNNTPTLF